MNQRQKGARGERLWRDELREQGFEARRGQQFSGGSESPDVVCEELKNLHMEVKFVEREAIRNWMAQAQKDAKDPEKCIVAHKTSRHDWLVTMPTELFFGLLREGLDHLK